MPLRIVRSSSSEALWAACRDRFLDEVGEIRGPGGFPARLWVVHRSQRDALLVEAARRGLPGWLDPPFSFLSALPDRFRIGGHSVGLLTGRLLVARLAARNFRRCGLGREQGARGPARAHVLDALFGELLPEGVTPEALRTALESLDGDEFARRRNEWVASTYEDLLAELRKRGRYDPRSIHALVARRIEEGALPDALGDANRLHVYGLVSLHRRRRLVFALAAQPAVDVVVYLPIEPEGSEWDEIPRHEEDEVVPGLRRDPRIHSLPDARLEAEWVAAGVKRALVEDGLEPHQVAVVARSGGDDVRRVQEALRDAGMDATVRSRTTLGDVAALRTLLGLFGAQAQGWRWRELRPLCASPFLGLGLDLRPLDFLARERRISGLEEWRRGLERLRERLGGEEGRWLEREGVWADAVEETISSLEAFGEAVADFDRERTEAEWIALTLGILRGNRFGLRQRVCRPAADRWDLVRLDQQGILALEALLSEWLALGGEDEPLAAADWHQRLLRLLEANEIALTTPELRGVQVLEAHEAALTPFRRVYLIHANDGVFPRPWTSRGVFSEGEASVLRAAGLPIPTRAEAQLRERALWTAVTSACDVTVTWRTAGPTGDALLPSLFLVGDRGDEQGTGTPAPEASDSSSPGRLLQREAEELAARRRSGDVAPFGSVNPGALRRALLAAWTEELRGGALDSEESPVSLLPHPWNGELRDPVVCAALAAAFGEDRVWSASQLEQYGRRPFDFLVERVLRLRASEEADEATAPARAGTLAHAVLEEFYRRYLERPPSALDAPAARVLEEVATAVFRRAEESEDVWLGEPALWSVTRERVLEEVRGYLDWELPWMAAKRESPMLVEVEFGAGDVPAVRVEGTDLRGRPSSLLLRGRVDRVDRKEDGEDGALKVLDYKSGGIPPAAGHRDGSVLQTALYREAVESLLGRPVEAARYRSIRSPGEPANGASLSRTAAQETLAFALAIPSRVRAGLFEAAQAKSYREVLPWQFDRSVTRSTASLPEGSRFDLDTPGMATSLPENETGGSAEREDA